MPWRSLLGNALGGVLPRSQGWARPVPRSLPSTTFYFTGPLAGLIGNAAGQGDYPIRRLSPTVFACGETAVIVRYAGEREFNLLRRGKFRQIYLVMDDDLHALRDGDGLPENWRRRLVAYRDGALRRLLPLVTHVVAPSADILEAYRGHETFRLDPAQCHVPPGLDHHDRSKGLDIVFAATRSHLKDLQFFAPALAGFLKRRPDARLTTFLNGHAPESIRHLPNVTHYSPMAWEEYRRFVAARRFHVAIAPALDTAFNRARSCSRLHDHAAYGAAGLYSAQAPFAGLVDDGKSGRLLPNDPDAWQEMLLELADDRDAVRNLAEGGQRLSAAKGDRGRVRAFWQGRFGFG